MPRSIFPLAILAVFACVPALIADDGTAWSRFRGPNGSGVANNQNIPVKFGDGDGIAWKTAIDGVGNGSPVVWKDLVFLQSSTPSGDKRSLVCLDAKTGKELWTRSQPGKKVYAHPRNSLSSSTPATDGEGVYISFWDGEDIILAGYTVKGDPLWTKNLGPWNGDHGAGSSPIVFKDKVYFVNDMDRQNKAKKTISRPSIVLALDKKTGNVAWEMPREAFRACYSAPLVLEKPGKAAEIVITSTTAVTSYNPDTGTENWHWNWKFAKTPLRTVASSFLADGLLIAAAGDGGGDRHLCAIELNESGPKLAWENKKDFPYVPCCVSEGSHLYAVHDKNTAACYEAHTGKQVWQARLGDADFTASPVLIDGKIYAASEQGNVFVFAAEPKYSLLARNAIGEMIRATPAVSDGRLFIRGQEHLFCISKKN